MFISRRLRKDNIAEYLLYMWQVEDIIRAYGCSLTTLRRDYISQFDYDEGKREELTDWYGDLIRMINQEDCREKGHLQINKVVMMQLTDLHRQLLESPKFPFYTSEYYKVLPFIVELRRRGVTARPGQPDANENGEDEIETCFNALYGTMILRLQKKEISQNTLNAIKEITTFIGMLSDYYKKDREEGLDFGD